MEQTAVKSINKRKFARFAKSIPVRLEIKEKDKRGQGGLKVFNTVTKDIGEGGVSLDMKTLDAKFFSRLFRTQERLYLIMTHPQKTDDLRIKTNIAWIKEDSGIGIRFVDIVDKERDRLLSYILNKTKTSKAVTTVITPDKKEIDIDRRVKATISRVARIDESEFNEDTVIREGLGIDSLRAMEILAAIETILKIKIDEAKAFDVVTVRDLTALVKSCMA
ncbi:MAG: phosphopantetheine-binding protein [Nitrospinota bacterium]